MKKKYIIEVDESEIMEYWSEPGVKEIGYQEYSLKSCPNIKVKPYEERPQGEWLWLGDNPNPNHKWSCNKCGRGVKEQENFCPNCGAKMKGGAE